MDYERLNTFHAVAREGSFSGAARQLRRTQPAVSQAVRLLEEQLGERLFLRLGRSVRLTQAGQLLLEHVERALGALEEAQRRIEALKELREGQLTLAASDTTACYILPEALGCFHARYPGVEIRILNRPTPATAQAVARHEADLGLVTLPLEQAGLHVESLAQREDGLIMPPDHHLAGSRRLDLAIVATEPLLLLDRESNTRRWIDRQLAARGLQPRVALELGSIEVIKRLVQHGLGLSIVPRLAVGEEVRQGTLAYRSIFRKQDSRALGAVYPQGGFPPLAAQVFLKVLRQQMATNRTKEE